NVDSEPRPDNDPKSGSRSNLRLRLGSGLWCQELRIWSQARRQKSNFRLGDRELGQGWGRESISSQDRGRELISSQDR
ncbi:hypothetical protein HAX54_006083, partial [Datura stramonium]|nr:hypothetical protein [Datura stramonium]